MNRPFHSGITIIDWHAIADTAVRRFKRKEERLKKRKFYRKWEYSDLPSYKEIVNSGRIRYKSFTEASRFYFDNCSLRLGYMQKKLFNQLIVSILKKLFGDDLIANLKFLSSNFNIEQLCNAVAILFPRMLILLIYNVIHNFLGRSGKTEGCALFIAILAVSQPDWNSTMYNLTLKQAREFLHASIKHLIVFQNDATFGWKLTKRDDKQMVEIKTNKYGTKNSVKSYPCALKDGKIGQRSTSHFRKKSLKGEKAMFVRFLSFL
jgi:hypothetical protein